MSEPQKTIEVTQVKQELIEIATQVIIHAGNVRALVSKALDAAHDSQMEECKQYFEDANHQLCLAHKCQTQLLIDEARGESIPFSILLVHAQDTLMIAMSELRMAKYLLRFQNCSCLT